MSGGSSDQRRVFLATALVKQLGRRIAAAFAAVSATSAISPT
jgi:hypothetical protein